MMFSLSLSHVSLIAMYVCARALPWPFAPWEGFQGYFHEYKSLSRGWEQTEMTLGVGGHLLVPVPSLLYELSYVASVTSLPLSSLESLGQLLFPAVLCTPPPSLPPAASVPPLSFSPLVSLVSMSLLA